jgi:O-acetyl-ADP-ribose deacetylase (regulator of RNase III)
MIEYKTGDLIKDNYPIFCHQVNCRGVMGSGIAKQIKGMYPEVFERYHRHSCTANYLLGTILPVTTHDGRLCVNMYAQDGYGRDQRYTDYEAFKSCLNYLQEFIEDEKLTELSTIAFPYRIGCGLAGGDWDIVLKMIENFADNIKPKVVIVKYEN